MTNPFARSVGSNHPGSAGSALAARADRWLLNFLTVLSAAVRTPTRDDRRDRTDRGDVPGWVMITMMTAIVVIALLVVFRAEVVNAVQNAFRSITG